MHRISLVLVTAAALAGCQPQAGSPLTDGPGGAPDAAHDLAAASGDGPGGADLASGDLAAGVACSGASPSFMNDVHPILKGCGGGELCHGGLASGAWPYTSLVNVKVSRDRCDPSAVIVAPGNLAQSYLMNKLTGVGICPGTSRMPPNGLPPLPQHEIQLIADWICQGARNN